MDPGHLSYSKISTYLSCPFKYKLIYQKGVKAFVNEKGDLEPIKDMYFNAFGQEIHTMFENFWKMEFLDKEKFFKTFIIRWRDRCNGKLEGYPPVRFLDNSVKIKRNPEIPSFRKRLIANGIRMLIDYYNRNFPLKYNSNTIVLEEFKEDGKKKTRILYPKEKKGGKIVKKIVTLDEINSLKEERKNLVWPEWEFECVFDGKRFVGKIDRREVEKVGDNEIHRIFDYKTHADPPKNVKEANFSPSFQFTLYRFAYKQITGFEPGIFIYYPNADSTYPIHFEKNSEKDLAIKVNVAYYGINRDEFPQHKNEFSCNKLCEFYDLCILLGNNPHFDLEKRISSRQVICSPRKLAKEAQINLFEKDGEQENRSKEILSNIGKKKKPVKQLEIEF